jgi:thiamine biosynthesis lipoprotein
MGTDVRILCEQGDAVAARAVVEEIATRLTRFDAGSELSRLNADPRAEVPASPLLRAAVRAAVAAAHATDGLVDPTVLDAVEAAGYMHSRRGVAPADLRDALRTAPPRRPAHPDPRARWRAIEVTDRSIRRPPGLRIDLGGIAKGLAADLAAAHLVSGVVDCGGDIRVAGPPRVVLVAHPLTGEPAAELTLDGEGVATSGVDRRIWAGGHHLIDPSTRRPAWTGVIAATAVAPTAAEAEALAKAALLTGRPPDHGVLVLDDGEVIA